MTLTGVISYPIPPYSNVPIQPEFYQPSRFIISAITTGQTTQITTAIAHNYVVGQAVRLLIPQLYGSFQLNEAQGLVLSIPSPTQVILNIDSTQANAFIASPYTATITNITQSVTPTVTAANSFVRGNSVIFSSVGGMTELNGLVGSIVTVSPTSFTININTSGFSPYGSGGIATLYNVPQTQAQILAIGDINSGIISSTGRVQPTTNIPGSFINISP